MDNEIMELQRQVAEKQSLFEKKQEVEKPVESKKNELVEAMFEQAIEYEVQNNEELKENVLETAKTFVGTKMQTIATNVDTEHKEAVFNNRKDACESYGFNEKTTPIWATKVMSVGYSIMLAIWLLLGSVTFMPVIFIAKKISVGLKKTWLAVLFALLLYLGVTFVPILLALLNAG